MGGKLCLPRYGWCIRQQNPNQCKENHTSTPKTKGHRRNLSAVFQYQADDAPEAIVPTENMLNINTATEEELMTLPGINRQTAQNIVEYRGKLIGGFKKVEDLALVSGVGATRLGAIRLDICVGYPGPKSKGFRVSTPDGSIADLDNISRTSGRSQTGQPRSHTPHMTSLNQSNVFQLMKVKGITQVMAENIVAHRDKKGNFKSIDDLVKVKGISHGIVGAIRQYLVLNQEEVGSISMMTKTSDGQSSGQTSHVETHNSSSDTLDNEATVNNNNNPSKEDDLTQEDLASLYGPLLRKSFRSKRKPVLLRKYNRPIMRIGSWNLDRCSLSKAENPGVREVVAMSVLENGLSVVAVQELLEEEALIKLCEELNTPVTPNVKKWHGYHGNWKCAVSSQPVRKLVDRTPEHLGFLYDSSRGLEISNIAILDRCRSWSRAFEDKLFLVSFKVGNGEFVVINIDTDVTRLDATSNGEKFSLSCVLDAVEEFMPGEKDIMILGNFNADPDHEAFSCWKSQGYQSALVADTCTNISTHNPEGTKTQQIIWLGPQIHKLFTGETGVVRQGLTSPWIPDGWGWGGTASSHCPIWTELYMTSQAYNDLDLSQGQVTSHKAGFDTMKMTVPLIGAGDM